MEINVVAKNTAIIGDIISEGDFRIDGTLEGNIKTKGRVIIGISGSVKGKIDAVNSDIEGKFSGDLLVQETLTIKATAIISGDVVIGKLSVEPGATFNASCSMRGAIKELNKPNEQQKLSEKTA
ncbi:polymer-forming cytoskeletal protein [Flavobacteriaceae bacterium]|jgi:cytoskeletal protein CcmA (bactofilin family)|nr:polymer-forming cytoskeletal protein [Flavobacteriaceae bacterium]MDB2413565.1 polymer-forming cytoskeletal protein [Flavobacteriaceae bacterium]MDB2632848.1 polymer-forming cytoskeletal protein [Flavobacteriaceae bacterium]MDB2684889.1 polymer-forming cytoskeletal protein [Flavobacteriaceae bacterium]MDC0330812.1 polymer-forming cytoskeletal protein [Flavobacteriaceae bacterium]